MKILLAIDLQNDFISGSLGTKEAQAIIPNVKEKIENFDGDVIFTRDTHHKDYLKTQEGKNLPVKHCIIGTDGWHICNELKPYVKEGNNVHDKISFGSIDLPNLLVYKSATKDEEITEIEMIGLCTGICVLSNAMILKAAFPEVNITVDASCCACVSPESHKTALEAMKLCQINVINE